MPPEQQERVQQQMGVWASLTPDQRRVAREQYKSLKKLPPEERQAVREKWQEYQQLPPEKRRELARKGEIAAGRRQPNVPAPGARRTGTWMRRRQPTDTTVSLGRGRGWSIRRPASRGDSRQPDEICCSAPWPWRSA
jgi:hypothetical protein